MFKEQETYSEEQNIVIFNILKKVLNTSFSSLDIYGISSFEAGIEKRNCLLLKYKNRYLFLSNPKLTTVNSRLSLYSDNKLIQTFNKKNTTYILNYLHNSGYISLFFNLKEKEGGNVYQRI